MNYTYSIYGLTMTVPFPCPMLTPVLTDNIPDIRIVEGPVPRSLVKPVVEDQNWQATPGSFLLRGGHRAGRFLAEGGERITLQRNPAAEDDLLCALLLTSVIAALLHQRGLLVLHANVVMTPHGAVAISGEAGAGKSTTQAVLLDWGCRMIADDVTVLSQGADGQIVALPGVPKMNLCEDTAINFGYEVAHLLRNPLLRSKVIVPVTLDATMTEPVPLKSIYHLNCHTGKDLIVTPLTGVKKFEVLQECIYGPQFSEELTDIFIISNVLIKQIDMFSLSRPSDKFTINEVVGAILNG
jgi:hypothetical protein